MHANFSVFHQVAGVGLLSTILYHAYQFVVVRVYEHGLLAVTRYSMFRTTSSEHE